MDNQRLPDTPWHIGYAKKKEDDPRRHKARCIHNEKQMCTYGKIRNFGHRCAGSSHCKYYAETEEQFDVIQQASMSVDEEGAERALKYRYTKIVEWEKLCRLGAEELTKKYGKSRVCPVCREIISGKGYCMYCGFNIQGNVGLVKKPLLECTNKTTKVSSDMVESTAVKSISSNSKYENIRPYQKVKHKKWGEGIISRLSEDKVYVKFSEGEKKFQFPEAFEKGFLI